MHKTEVSERIRAMSRVGSGDELGGVGSALKWSRMTHIQTAISYRFDSFCFKEKRLLCF